MSAGRAATIDGNYPASAGNSAAVEGVASAPKNESLYESLLRYHNENDDESDDDSHPSSSRRRRKKNQHGPPSGPVKTGYDDDPNQNDSKPPPRTHSNDNLKLPANPINNEQRNNLQLKKPPSYSETGTSKLKPQPSNVATNLKKPPPRSRPGSGSESSASLKPPPKTARNVTSQQVPSDISLRIPKSASLPRNPAKAASSFYQAALQASYPQGTQQQHSSTAADSATPTKKPGIVMVNEPAVRPDSAMYRLNYGGDQRLSTSTHSTSGASRESRGLGSAGHYPDVRTLSLSADDGDFFSDENPGPPSLSRSEAGNLVRRSTSLNPGSGLRQGQSRHTEMPYTAVPDNRRQVGRSEGGNHSSDRRQQRQSTNPPMMRSKSGDDVNLLHSSSPYGYTETLNDTFLGERSRSKIARRNKSTGTDTSFVPLIGYREDLQRHSGVPAWSSTPPGAQDRLTAQPATRKDVAYDHSLSNLLPRKTSRDQPHLADEWMGAGRPNSGSNKPHYPRFPETNTVAQQASTSFTQREDEAQRRQRNRNQSTLPTIPKRSVDVSTTNADSERRQPRRSSSAREASDMDDELRLALEISKQDTGGRTHMRSQSSQDIMPSSRGRDSCKDDLGKQAPGPPRSSFSQEAVSQAYDGNDSMQDIILALKLSAEEATGGGGAARDSAGERRTTNLDELLAWEESHKNQASTGLSSDRSVTDYVAAGISTDRTTAAVKMDATTTPYSTPAAPTTSPTSPTSVENAAQARILAQIREEQEQKELQMALQASRADSSPVPALSSTSTSTSSSGGGGGGSRHHQHQGQQQQQHRSDDFFRSQQRAMAEYHSTPDPQSRNHPDTTTPRGQQHHQSKRHHAHDRGTPTGTAATRTARHSSHSSSEASSDRRRELLKRGTRETRAAISSGRAQIIKCRGCGGRLQAPVSYSLVFCPTCQTISPT